ncbi:RAxF-45 family protein [Mesobacillus boroniphilus]|uniref:RAxF-45 family protein n=1 Tax=Mesobacillus boroniphilus TaxID=308892 RepID=UPI000A5B2CAA|nr:RAxF-45 family protein [Mesobacillus boroniphilus]
MIKTVFVRGFWNEFLYFCCAKFAVAAANGIRMSFFNSSISNTNDKIISFPA